MSHVNDLERAALTAILGHDGKLNALERDWLNTEHGISIGPLNSMWMELFGKALPWEGAAMSWLQAQGIAQGPISTMWAEYWELANPDNANVIAAEWVPALSGSDGVYITATHGSLDPTVWDGSTITRLGSDNTNVFRVDMDQFVGIGESDSIRVTVVFAGPKTRQATLNWSADRYHGTMANARELAVADIGNTLTVVLRKILLIP